MPEGKRVWESIVPSLMAAIMFLGAPAPSRGDVIVTSPATGRILVLDGAGTVTRVLGEAGGVQQPSGIVLDPTRHMIVADHGAGRVLRLAPDGSNGMILAWGIPKPDGPSVGPRGEIFLVSRNDAASIQRSRPRSTEGDPAPTRLNQVWRIPSGGGAPEVIATLDEATHLVQTHVVGSGPYEGDLLVLSARPGRVVRLTSVGSGAFERRSDFIAGFPVEPSSMAAATSGEILVSTTDGRILRYTDAGARLAPDFASGLPLGRTRVSVGLEGLVHVTPQGGSSVIRFDSRGARLTDLFVTGVPLAAAVATGCVPTPVGDNVAVSPGAGVSVVFDRVVEAGQTCLQTTPLAAGETITPRGNLIPDWARKLWEDPGFVVHELTTTACFEGSVGEEFFSQNPDARLLHATGSGQVMEDITVLVTPNDPRGRSGGFSEFVVYLDTRPVRDVILLKLAKLQQELDVESDLAQRIAEEQLEAIRAWLDGMTTLVSQAGPDIDRAEAIRRMLEMKAYVRANTGEAIPGFVCEGTGRSNPAGWLVAWIDTWIFHMNL